MYSLLRTATVCATIALASLGHAHAANKFVYANNSNYDTLDPHTVFDTARSAVRFNLYDGLYRWVDNPPKMIPWLAESHSVSDDGKVYTVKLRSDAKFHDGQPLTADDVVYSMERILGLKLGVASYFMPLIEPGNTHATDPHTVTFTLKAPSAVFASLLPDLLVVNSKLVKANEKNGDWGRAWIGRNDAGSGSFSLKRYNPAVGFSADRFKDHFAGWGDKYLDEVEFRTVLETNTRVLGMQKGDYHGTDGYLAPDQVERLRKSKGVDIHEEQSMRVFHMSMHNSRPPFNDIHFRKAVAHAFDYEGYIRDVMKGTVVRNPTMIPVNMWGAAKVPGYTFDLDKAREELAKMKEPLRPITIGTLAGFSETEQAASLLQNGLNKIGVEVKIESAPWPTISSRMIDPNQQYDMVPYWISTYYADPDNWLGTRYGPDSTNTSYYKNPEVLDRIREARRSNDQATRERLYEEADRITYEDAAGVWIYNTNWFGPYSDKVQGVRFAPTNNGQDMRWISFK
jgi:peptide/nickel transport system substrate-binding protein